VPRMLVHNPRCWSSVTSDRPNTVANGHGSMLVPLGPIISHQLVPSNHGQLLSRAMRPLAVPRDKWCKPLQTMTQRVLYAQAAVASISTWAPAAKFPQPTVMRAGKWVPGVS